MIIYVLRVRLSVLIFATLLAVLVTSCADAQTNFNVKKTQNPDEYVAVLLDDIEEEGMASIRQVFEAMGLNNPQNDAAISIYEQTQNESDARWTDLIGVVDTGEVLKQYYGYAYLGGNGWIFLRIEFLRAGEKDWVLSSLTFNSEYEALLKPKFDITE